ncbi:MAG: hypothetical protein GX308_04940 [Epulopiscium sp.]|nr:hypothetical protein [Candidatus Epulonipiscium sp.]
MSRRYNQEQYIFGSAAPKINTHIHDILAQEDNGELYTHYSKKEKIQKAKRTVSYRLRLVGNVFLIFIGCLFLMGQYASIAFNQKEINTMKSDLKEIKNTNALLKSEIAGSIDLTAIKEKAIQGLGMIEPAPHQIVYINIPKISYTAYYQPEKNIKQLEEETTNKDFVAASFFDFLNWKE